MFGVGGIGGEVALGGGGSGTGGGFVAGVGAVQRLQGAAGATCEAGASATAGGHCGSIEDGSGVSSVENLVEAFDGGFEEAVDLVGTGELKKGAKDLWGAEG